MSLDRRWQLITPTLCSGGIRIEGAGSSAANGDYCPDGTENGRAVWTRIGGTRLLDSIYWADAGIGPAEWWMNVSGATLYVSISGVGVPSNWIQAAGASPAPVNVFLGEQPYYTPEPLGLAKFAEEEDLSFGLIAKRRKLTTDLVFVGADYNYFLAIKRDVTRRCEEIIIRRQWKCNGRWVTYWKGTFSAGVGTWDFDNCTFTVKPEVLDRYTCIVRALDKKVNVLGVAPVMATALVSVSIEWGATINYGVATPCNRAYNVEFDGGGAPINGWTLVWSTFPDGGFIPIIDIYWREILTTFCVGGVPVPPTGVGWTLLTNNCGVDGTAVYVRPPTISYTFGDAVAGSCVGDVPIPPDDTCLWQLVLDCPPDDCTGTVSPNGPWYVCYDPTPTELPRARPMMDVAEFMVEQSGCGLGNIISDFFEYNPPGTAPEYVAGINYVTGQANQVDALVILQNSDAIDPAATNPATLGEMTLKELFVFFVVEFDVYWAIDDDGNLRLEHWIFWTFPIGLDLNNYGENDKSEPRSYTHLNVEIPRIERVKPQHALNVDFVGADIEYSGPCVTGDEGSAVKEYALGPFTTDISFILTDPTAINKIGFTVLATVFDGSVYNTIVSQGALSGNFISNAPLSIANAQRDYWTWDRFLFDGRMNRQDVTFDGIKPNIEQKNVVVKMCCDALDFVSTDRVVTVLGADLGGLNPLTAFVRRLEFDEATECATMTLRYAY